MIEFRWGMSGVLSRPWVWGPVALLVLVGGVSLLTGVGRKGDDIQRMTEAKNVSGLARVVADGSDVDAGRAMKALGNIGGSEATETILAAVKKDPRPVIRRHAVFALARATQRRRGDVLADVLHHDDDAAVRAAAARAIGEVRDYEHLPDLVTAMEEDTSELVFRQAERSGGRICGVVPGYSSRDPIERRKVAAKFYGSCWKVYGEIITRYHKDLRDP